MRAVPLADISKELSDGGTVRATGKLSSEQLVAVLKSRLADTAVGKFYREAEEAGMALETYLGSLLK